MIKTISELYNTGAYSDSDKGTVHSYMDGYYSNEFTPKKDDTLLFLEIGIRHGGSIRLWKDWFTNSKIVGIDICSLPRIDGVELIDGDAYDDKIVNIFDDESIDYLIDDGPHTLESQLTCVKKYFSKIKPGGKLIIEDIQNYDLAKPQFEELELLNSNSCEFEIIDLRDKKSRKDDILFIFHKEKTP